MADFREQTRHELLEKRMLRFAVDVIRTLEQQPALPRSTIDQLTRSATSIGANYAEACNAVSKLNFRNKIYTAKKEAAETRFWIDLCSELSDKSAWSNLRQESHELLVILQTIISPLKNQSAA